MAAEIAGHRLSPVRRSAVALLAVAAGALLLDAGWIHAKASLAQHLLDRAWQAGLTDGIRRPPWPWADTHPVARLRLARLGTEQIVLAGDNGRTLAFGPGWAEASAAPGGPGTIAISGHRDTHFRWLRDVRVGDIVELETEAGIARYRVVATTVADVRRDRLQLLDDGERLLLVTCWPFDAVTSGGPQRFVVAAERCDPCVGSA